MTQHSSIGQALTRLAQLSSAPLDALRLQQVLREALGQSGDAGLVEEDVSRVADQLGWPHVEPLAVPDRARLPLLAQGQDGAWGVVRDMSPDGRWVFEGPGAEMSSRSAGEFRLLIRVDPFARPDSDSTQSFSQVLRASLRNYRGRIGEAIAASVFINFLAAVVSFFSMQVYDKVIPSHSIETLIVFLIGVMILIGFEWIMKLARSRIMDAAIAGVDAHLSREIFERLLRVRLDQMPASVGSLAGQLRGYEQVRNFYTASTLFSLVDLPAALIFLAVIALVANPWVAFVPLVMAVVSLAMGVVFRRRIEDMALTAIQEANLKTGLLVETVEGAETVKAAQGGWQFLSKWVSLSSASIRNDLRSRHLQDGMTYYLAAAQQMSYVLLVGVGAWFVVAGDMTVGSLVAASILGGRVLSAVMQLPNLMAQQAHAKAAIANIEQLYQLKTDNHGIAKPLVPSRLLGDYAFQDVAFAYPDCPPAVQIQSLQIRAGERVAVLGPIGSGKSTLLKVMAGLYAPAQGRVLIDGMDVAQIAKEAMSRNVAYLQQDHRLFHGTLRENLLVGLPDPGDDALREAMTLTGLDQLVASHPRGLELPIFEGGRGLSGGQKQLVAFTRMLLAQPRVMLLDEPTASMDEALERRCLQVLQSEAFRSSTLLLVTHKPALLALVSRIVVVMRGRIVLDGPKDEVLARLQQPVAAPVAQVAKSEPSQAHELADAKAGGA